MKYLILVIGACLALTNASPTSIEFKEADWLSYKTQFNKVYENDAVESTRKIIFAHNKRLIDDFNAKQSGEKGFVLGLNDFSDVSQAELQSIYKSHKAESRMQNSLEDQEFLNKILNDKSTDVPDEVDWRKSGRVTSVKNEGSCNAGWAFSAVGALEGQELVRSNTSSQSGNTTIELSAQNLIDCDGGSLGCIEGFLHSAFRKVRLEGGINDAETYPYEDETGTCRFNKDKVAMTISGAAFLPFSDEETLKEIVAKFGPVPTWVAVHGNEFLHYKAGIFNDPSCSGFLNHPVLVVGYGTDKQFGDYWILKNSWGTDWGEDGYMRLARNAGQRCGISELSVIPTFE